MNRVQWQLVFTLAVSVLSGSARAQNARLPDVVYMDQPTGIDPAVYVAAWPRLEPYLRSLKTGPSSQVEAALRIRAAASDVSDGELNLLAQLAWQHGDLDLADTTIGRAVAMQPKQPLNAFQQAMVTFAHLRRASGFMEQWKWQRQTRDAYQKTFDLDPHNVSARYYLAYSYMNTPWIGGGDTKKALSLSDGGIAIGQPGFYVVRADAHRLRGEMDAANADYATSIKLRVFKLSGFVDAAQEELSRNQPNLAKHYLDWALYCRPDASTVYEGLGDYYLATKDREQARHAYQTAVQKNPDNASAKKKLSQLPTS